MWKKVCIFSRSRIDNMSVLEAVLEKKISSRSRIDNMPVFGAVLKKIYK